MSTTATSATSPSTTTTSKTRRRQFDNYNSHSDNSLIDDHFNMDSLDIDNRNDTDDITYNCYRLQDDSTNNRNTIAMTTLPRPHLTPTSTWTRPNSNATMTHNVGHIATPTNSPCPYDQHATLSLTLNDDPATTPTPAGIHFILTANCQRRQPFDPDFDSFSIVPLHVERLRQRHLPQPPPQQRPQNSVNDKTRNQQLCKNHSSATTTQRLPSQFTQRPNHDNTNLTTAATPLQILHHRSNDNYGNVLLQRRIRR